MAKRYRLTHVGSGHEVSKTSYETEDELNKQFVAISVDAICNREHCELSAYDRGTMIRRVIHNVLIPNGDTK